MMIWVFLFTVAVGELKEATANRLGLISFSGIPESISSCLNFLASWRDSSLEISQPSNSLHQIKFEGIIFGSLRDDSVYLLRVDLMLVSLLDVNSSADWLGQRPSLLLPSPDADLLSLHRVANEGLANGKHGEGHWDFLKGNGNEQDLISSAIEISGIYAIIT